MVGSYVNINVMSCFPDFFFHFFFVARSASAFFFWGKNLHDSFCKEKKDNFHDFFILGSKTREKRVEDDNSTWLAC